MTIKLFFELEPFITLITLERSLLGMIGDNVRSEMTLDRASKLALVTLEWFFAFNKNELKLTFIDHLTCMVVHHVHL